MPRLLLFNGLNEHQQSLKWLTFAVCTYFSLQMWMYIQVVVYLVIRTSKKNLSLLAGYITSTTRHLPTPRLILCIYAHVHSCPEIQVSACIVYRLCRIWLGHFFFHIYFHIYIFSYICTCFGYLLYEEALTLSKQSLFLDMMNIPSQNFSNGKHQVRLMVSLVIANTLKKYPVIITKRTNKR